MAWVDKNYFFSYFNEMKKSRPLDRRDEGLAPLINFRVPRKVHEALVQVAGGSRKLPAFLRGLVIMGLAKGMFREDFDPYLKSNPVPSEIRRSRATLEKLKAQFGVSGPISEQASDNVEDEVIVYHHPKCTCPDCQNGRKRQNG